MGILKREEISAKDKWAIEDLYADNELWSEDVRVIKEKIKELGQYAGKLSESSNTLLKALRLCNVINEKAEKVYVYANQRLHENTANEIYQELSSKAQMLVTEISEASAYITPEILAMDEERLHSFQQENEGLKVYRRFLSELMRKKEHVLSAEMEEMLASITEVTEAPSDIFAMFNNADLKFDNVIDENGEEAPLTHGRFVMYLESQNRKVRKNAFENMYKPYLTYQNTLAATFRANVKQETFYAKARGYKSSLHGALDGGNIPVSVYENLLESVHESLPKFHKYLSLRKQVLELDELHMYDLYVPIISDVEMKIPFDQAKQIVKEGLMPLGDEYIRNLELGYNGGWIDTYENEGKRSGAYSWGAYGTHPYVLLNYQENLNNVFTLAHEMGHAMHSYYSDNAQPYIYAGYKIFVAEVASTCNEALLIHHMLNHAKSNDEKAYLINYFLEQFRGTVFRQTMFAEFEKKAHSMAEAGEVLTSDALNRLYYDLNKQYYGSEVMVDDQIKAEWSRIPHFYTPFYVYQYATGFSAAIAISSKLLKGDETARNGYFSFLKGGNSMDPIDLLKLCGVDMTTKTPVEDALTVFGSYVDELKKLIVK